MDRNEFLRLAAIGTGAILLEQAPLFAGAGGTIAVKGSDTMVILGQAWAEAFMEKNKSAKIAVTGGGSGTGIAALINGTCDVCQSSRAMRKSEIDSAKQRNRNPVEHIVGLDGLAIAVHASNSIEKLTMAQAKGIFTGQITDWSQVSGSKKSGKIVALARESNSGTHVFFKEHVLGNANFGATVLLMPSSKAIAQEVSQNRDAVGFSGVAYFKAQKGVKILDVAKDDKSPAVEPTDDNVRSNKYPVSRPLFLYTPGSPKGIAAEYINFIKSAEGQALVEKVGYVKMKK